ncbi:OmpL47-type beta-barrel domain-containing protein [Paenibacillus sp. GCM10012307]
MKKRCLPILLCAVLVYSLFVSIIGNSNVVAEGTPPVTSHVLNGRQAPNGIYYGPVEVQLSAYGSSSGVLRTQYSLDAGATWTVYSQPVMFSEKKLYQFLYRSIDNNNNIESPKLVEFTIKQDIFKPETTVRIIGAEGQNSYYTGPVSVVLEAEDLHSGVDYSEYSLDGAQTWVRYTKPFQLMDEKNWIIHYRSKDLGGNQEKTKKAKINIDITPPTAPDILSSPTEWSNSQFIVSLIDGVDKESGTMKSQYRIGSTGAWLDYSDPFSVGGNGWVQVYARTNDYAGKTSEVSERTLKFDKIAPTAPSIGLSTESWTNEDVYVSLIAGTDEDSKVRVVEYKTGTDIEWLEYVDSFMIRNEGITPIYARTADWAGNTGPNAESVAKIDFTPPGAPLFSPESENWTNKDVHLQIIHGPDALSGADYSQYTLDDSEEWTSYEIPLLFTDEGVTVVHAFTYDKAGNTSEIRSHKVRIDKTPPTVPILKATVTDWTNQNVQVTLDSGTDALSGVARNEYKIGVNGTWVEYSAPFTMSSEGDFRIFARTVDAAENMSEVTEIVVRIDKTPPSIPTNLFKVSQLGGTVLLRWTSSTDNLSGVALYEIYNGSNLMATSVENKIQLTNLQTNLKYSITVKAVDRAGNRSASSNPIVFNTNEPMITGGRDHNFAWNQQGVVRGWGNNNRGQLGDGTISMRYTPVQISALQGFTMIKTGVRDNIGLRPDGTVWIWGENGAGQIIAPTQINGLDNVVSISMGIQHYMALKDDGTVWAWGINNAGMLGDGTTTSRSTPVKVVGLNSIVAIANGYYHSMALREDGTVWVWGSNSRGQLGINAAWNQDQLVPVQISNLSNVAEISTSYMHSAVLKRDGTVWTWGFNDNGQLGNGVDFEDSFVPVQVQNLTGVIKISSSYAHNLALTDDGKVWAWGDNYYGQLGDGTKNKRKVPVQVAHMEGISEIFAGEYYSMAVKRNGSVWAWGINSYGQLGDGTTVNKITRNLVNGIPYPTDNIAPSAPGSLIVAGKTSNTVVLSWNEATDNHAVKEYLIYQGSTLSGTVGVDGNTIDMATTYTPTSLTPGSTYTFSVKARDYAGNLSASSNTVSATTEISFPLALSAASNHTLVLKSDGSIWGWGSNSNGQLGNLAGNSSTIPKQTVNLTSVISISAGDTHNLALMSDGTVWSWGGNSSGQLGNTTASMRFDPQKIEGLNSIIAVSAGHTHSLALKSDGTVWSWGSNAFGELGQGTTGNPSYTPKQILSLSGVKSISAGFFFNLVTKTDGTIWAWGSNSKGQLGNGTTTNASIPFQLTNLSNVIDISAGGYHSLALQQGGTVWAWGYNNSGQLGDGTKTDKKTPVLVNSLSGIKQVSAGLYFSMAMSDNTVYTWGDNSVGQLGNGSVANSFSTPVAVSSLNNIKTIDAGYQTGAALANNTVMSWGGNGSGQLGNGTKNNSRVPVAATDLVPTASASASSKSLAEKGKENNTWDEEIYLNFNNIDIITYDSIAPLVPQNVVAIKNGNLVTLRWSPSKDNVAVKEYWVYIDNDKVLQTKAYDSVAITVPADRLVSITVKAVDAAGNVSNGSVPISP